MRNSYEHLLGRGLDGADVAWASVGEPEDLEALLLLEGRAADAYWSALGVVRSYPNATDRTNALLNYAYALLASKCLIRLRALGADPAIGMLHEPQPRKLALVYDAMEPWRWFADRVALSVRDGLEPRDFSDSWGFGVRLKERAVHALVGRFEAEFSPVRSAFERDVEGLIRSFSVPGKVPTFHRASRPLGHR